MYASSPHRSAGRFTIFLRLTLLAVLGTLGMAGITARAQQLTGSLSGLATDQSGALIANAKVVLKNQASGDTRTTVTDAKGFFTITAIQPATYTISVSAKGFAGWQENDIVMNQGDQRNVANIKLAVGSETSVVSVVAGADAVVPLDTAEISTTINQQMINDIDLEGRNAGELLTLMPGMGRNSMTRSGSFSDQVTQSNSGPVGSFSSNGTQPNGSMAYILDGANLVDPGNAGTQIANINQDMVQEVKVLQSSYGAEYAKGPTIFEAFSKSGGNHFHGEAYIYTRNSAFNSFESYAKSQYVNLVQTNKLTPTLAASLNPESKYYYAGGNVGGPLLLPFVKFNKQRDKLFFWVGYEYMYQHPSSNPINFNVPTVAQRSGDFSNTGVDPNVISTWNQAYANLRPNSTTPNDPANIPGATNTTCGTAACIQTIPTSDIDSNAAALLKLYPLPNLTPTSGNGYSNYQYGNNTPTNRYEITGKVNYAITDNDKLAVSYTRQIEKDEHPISIWWAAPWTLPYPGNVVAATTSQEFLVNETHIFNSTTTNEFVYALARYINPSVPQNSAAQDRTALGFNVPGLFGHTSKQIPNIEGPWGGSFANISNFSFDGNFPGGAFGGLKKSPAIYDNFTKIIGTHSIKIGAYWDTQENLQSNTNPDQGQFNFGGGALSTGNVYADLMLSRPNNYNQQNTIPTDDLKYHQYSIYAQDSWRANPQLTLNFGLRLDHVGQWYGLPLGIQVWDPANYSNSPSAPANTGITWNAKNPKIALSGFNSPLFSAEPRVGFAYDVSGSGKTVFRGGIALFRYQTSVNDACAGGACDGPQGSFNYYTSSTILGGYAGIAAFSAPTGAPSESSFGNGASIGVARMGDSRTPTTLDWNLTVSQALPYRSVFEVSYVANKSTNEFINGSNGKYDDLNNIAPGGEFLPDPTNGHLMSPTQSGFNANHYRPLQNYGDVYLLTHGSYANYNSLQIAFQKQSGPVNFLTNYTFSKVLGIWDGDSSNGGGNGSMVNPFNLKNNYGPLAYDHSQILNLTYVWNLPSPIHGNRLLGAGINGWQLSGTTQYQTGSPLQPNFGGNMNAQYPGNLPANKLLLLPNGATANAINSQTWFGTTAYNVIVPQVTCDPRANLSKGQYFNPNCFAPPAYGQQGTLEMPYIHGPAYFNSDLGLFKNFKFHDSQSVQLRVSGRNFLNHPLRQFNLANASDQNLSFVAPDGSLAQTNQNASLTGKPGFTTGQRYLTFAAKYYF